MANDRIRNVLNEDVLMALLAMSQDPVKNLSGSANRPIPQAPDNMNPESRRDRNISAQMGRQMRLNPDAGLRRNRYPGRGTKFRPPTSAIGKLGFQGMGGSARNPMLDFLDALIRQAGYTKPGK